MEFDSATEWLVSSGLTSLIEDPSLVLTVMAVVEDNVSVVSVALSVNVQALVSVVSKVSDGSIVVLDSHVLTVIELSHDSSNIDSELVTSLVSKGEASS